MRAHTNTHTYMTKEKAADVPFLKFTNTYAPFERVFSETSL